MKDPAQDPKPSATIRDRLVLPKSEYDEALRIQTALQLGHPVARHEKRRLLNMLRRKNGSITMQQMLAKYSQNTRGGQVVTNLEGDIEIELDGKPVGKILGDSQVSLEDRANYLTNHSHLTYPQALDEVTKAQGIAIEAKLTLAGMEPGDVAINGKVIGKTQEEVEKELEGTKWRRGKKKRSP